MIESHDTVSKLTGKPLVRAVLVQHSTLSNEHYSPAWISQLARDVMGKIDLDPASSIRANEVTRANTIHTDDGALGGLGHQWCGNVFLNPPGGKLDRVTLHQKPRNEKGLQTGTCFSSSAVWWHMLENEWKQCRVTQAIFVAFNMSVFRTSQALECRPPFHFPMLVPSSRICFDVVGPDGVRRPGKSPPQDSAIIYLPDVPRDETQFGDYEAVKRFKLLGRCFGEVRC